MTHAGIVRSAVAALRYSLAQIIARAEKIHIYEIITSCIGTAIRNKKGSAEVFL
jgi:hypothetical protein